MSYVHDDQYASLLGRGVRDRAVLVVCRVDLPTMSMLGEHLQKEKAERDALLDLLWMAEEMIKSRVDHDWSCPRSKDDYACTCGLSQLRRDIADTHDGREI